MRNAVLLFSLAYLFISFFSLTAVASSIPYYTPSYVFSTPQQVLYLFLSNDESTGLSEFLSLNISSGFSAANPQYSVLFDEPPFYGGNATTNATASRVSFIPVIDGQGIIKVYAGDCETAASQGALWQFTPDKASAIGNGSWNQVSLSPANQDTAGINYEPAIHLAGGFAHTSANSNSSSVYTFGGMCPMIRDVLGHVDRSRDYYSQSMILLEPAANDDTNNYKFCTTGGRALPVPQAGFTLTPLQLASTIEASGGVLEQQNFLLIGGHSANHSFVNMTHLGLFSLPQNSWSFVDVASSDEGDDGNDDASGLVMIDTIENSTNSVSANIQPRSGHSAILTPDGTKVVIFGGYIGNASTASQPQLAILEVGEGYGGSGQWAWKTPSAIPSLGSGVAGIYGHGATILPGNMMMIAGGYTIPSMISGKNQNGKRAAPLNSQVYLYNITSNSWATSYTNPNSIGPTTTQPTASTASGQSGTSTAPAATTTMTTPVSGTTTPTSSSPSTSPSSTTATHDASQSNQGGPLSTKGKRAGLGLGLGVGATLLALAAICACFRRKTETRDSTIRDLAKGAERSHYWDDPSMSSSFRVRTGSNNSTSLWNPRQGGGTVFPWVTANVGNQQRDEEASAEQTGLLETAATTDMRANNQQTVRKAHPQQQKYGGNSGGRKPSLPGEIHPIDEREEDEEIVTQRLLQQYQGEVQEAAAESSYPEVTESRDFAIFGYGARNNNNRPSPPPQADIGGAGYRTLSDLSNSANRRSRADGLIRWSIEQTPPSTSSGEVLPGAEKHMSTDSFSTARTRLSMHQGERESLLGGNNDSWCTPPESPSRTKSGTGSRPIKAYDLVGNVRRALSGTLRRPSASSKGYHSVTAEHMPSRGGKAIIDRSPTVIESSATSSRGRPRHEPPRRAVSASAASAAAYRHRKGAKDWGFVQHPAHHQHGHHARNGNGSGSGSDGSSSDTVRGEMRAIHPSVTRIPKIIPLATTLDGLYAVNANGDQEQQEQQRQRQQDHTRQQELDNDDDDDDDFDYDEDEWDVEAAAERRQVQMTFTVPREKLRVVNVSPRDMDMYSESSSIRKPSAGHDRHVS